MFCLMGEVQRLACYIGLKSPNKQVIQEACSVHILHFDNRESRLLSSLRIRIQDDDGTKLSGSKDAC